MVAIFSTFSTMHLLAHAVWAQVTMIAAGVQLAVARGRLTSHRWSSVSAAALLVSGIAFLIHEQNPWFYSRSAFLHHAIGWTLPRRGRVPAPAGAAASAGGVERRLRLSFIALAVLLYADRDFASIFGRFGEVAGR